MPIMAGPLAPADPNQPATDFAALIPPDKLLRPEWVTSLFARGTPWVYTKKRNELRYIGMPVGGLTCGTVYLGGDGRLWNWDIFNENQEGVLPRTVTWKGFGGTQSVKPRDGSPTSRRTRSSRRLSRGSRSRSAARSGPSTHRAGRTSRSVVSTPWVSCGTPTPPARWPPH